MGSYDNLRKKLAEPPVFNLPRRDLPYVLDTDADANQVGCVLMQKHPDGSLRAIGYFSKTLTKTERNYDTTEREALGIIWAVLLLRPYLESTRFTLRTDHGALKWIFGPTHKSGKLTRWRLRLQEFEFDVGHLPGIKNMATDVMSRMQTQEATRERSPLISRFRRWRFH